MAGLNVKVRDIDDDTLYTHKTIQIGSTSIDSPVKALPVGKMRRADTVSDSVRGFNEIYFKTTPDDLRDARKAFKSKQKKKKIQPALNKARRDEINVVFVELATKERVSDKNLLYLIDLLYSTSDILALPLMNTMLNAIKKDGKGVESRYFNRYFENLKRLLRMAIDTNKPVMGIVPALNWDFTNRVANLYLNNGIRAFCIDFNGKTVTAENQLTNTVRPLMRKIRSERIQEDVLIYSINAHRGRSRSGFTGTPANDFMTFGFGFDILGDKHISRNLPPHLFEQAEDETPKFRMFHRDDYVYQDHKYGTDLRQSLPSNTGLDPDRILDRPQDKYRFAALLNGEQQAFESIDLQPAIDEHRVVDHVQKKRGVGDDDLEGMRSTKKAYDGKKNQTVLSSLDDLI
ncbi:hypothetical protein [Haloferax larsenii]|uniref:Uncharacterized protein n=1 Tax=Haloferax larsenii TaxID=302484 RepID=A0A1H7KHS1_HALLR|nr:hypothetical protein [Haloferax larsenii]SEK86443.1 hypothetical protein SAMN04488691_10212 [Haloferax larsenii]